ncbi:MAG: ATP synthase F1 subunit delta [Balneolaceae bacterium]
MLVSKAARRYAKAFLELAIERKSVEDALKDILTIKLTIEGSRELILFLKSPIVKPIDKKEVLEAIFDGNISKDSARFVSLITEKGRENILHDIVTAFVNEYNKYAGIITVGVNSARELNKEQLDKITSILEKVTSKKVILSTKVKTDLIGGISIQIEDTVYDSTVKHKLNQLEARFLATAIN